MAYGRSPPKMIVLQKSTRETPPRPADTPRISEKNEPPAGRRRHPRPSAAQRLGEGPQGHLLGVLLVALQPPPRGDAFDQHLLDLLRANKISVETALKAASNPADFQTKLELEGDFEAPEQEDQKPEVPFEIEPDGRF